MIELQNFYQTILALYETWENHSNTEDEKPNNSLSMIDKFVENDLQDISILNDKRYHLNSREDRSNVTLQNKLH